MFCSPTTTTHTHAHTRTHAHTHKITHTYTHVKVAGEEKEQGTAPLLGESALEGLDDGQSD